MSPQTATDSSDFAQPCAVPSEEEIRAMDEGFAAAQRGEVVDADELIAYVRSKYGL